MKRLVAVAVLILMVAFSAVAQSKDKKGAQTSAENWLALVDKGSYGESWDSSASFFKSAVTKDKWIEMVKAVRPPLGDLVSRKLKSAEYKTSLPGAPDGEYVVIQYDSSFANKKQAVETLTSMVDKDGQWRVVGYFIR